MNLLFIFVDNQLFSEMKANATFTHTLNRGIYVIIYLSKYFIPHYDSSVGLSLLCLGLSCCLYTKAKHNVYIMYYSRNVREKIFVCWKEHEFSSHLDLTTYDFEHLFSPVFQTVDCNPFMGCDTVLAGCKTVFKKGNKIG